MQQTLSTPNQLRPVKHTTKVAICILTRRSEWQRRHLLRQTWLQGAPEGAQVSHIFVLGEDRSYTQEENARLAEEVQTYQDILIAPVEEAKETVAARTRHCITWTTTHHDFDVLLKVDDDSALFLPRLFGDKGRFPPHLVAAHREKLVYLGKRHALAKVAHPANFLGRPTPDENDKDPSVSGEGKDEDLDRLLEFDYRGEYWPDHMDGGMYGLSRGLAEKIVKSDFRTYTSEEATIGVWVSALGSEAWYLADEQVLSDEADYLASNGTVVAASFHTCRLRLASMWCEYGQAGTLSPGSILAEDVRKTLDCLSTYERSSQSPRSLPLGAGESHRASTLKSLKKRWPITERPNLEETSRWWAQMGGAFRGKPAAVVGNSKTSLDRSPLYLLDGIHTLVMDDFFRVSERYTSWKPTMYMCVDPGLCASSGSGGVGSDGQGRRGSVATNAESVNRFARDVFAAFYVLSGGAGGAEYWKYLRQRVNAHWFVAGFGDGGGSGGGGSARKLVEGRTDVAAAGMGPAVEMGGGGDKSPDNFRVSSQGSGVAMAVEVLSYLGFSPIYVTAANEELGDNGGGAASKQQWGEFSRAVKLAGSTYGTSVVYLYADDEDKLPTGRVVSNSATGADGKAASAAAAAAAGKLSGQEHITKWAKARTGAHGKKAASWDLEVFLRHFPVVNRLEIVRDASSVDGMFPRSPRCQDADDFDRFQKAVLCPVKTSLKHFSSFLAWHVPFGPVRGMFVWVKR